jgi:hypothetical protein
MVRTVIPHPAGHWVQTDFTNLLGPSSGTGVQGQFWDQMAMSSVSFHGTGVNVVPTAPPMTSDKKHLRSIFMNLPLVCISTSRL